MALSAKEKQKAYRMRQKLKKESRFSTEAKRESRRSMSPKQLQTSSDTYMNACLDGKVDRVEGVYARYDGEKATLVGPSFGPVYVSENPIYAFSLASGNTEESILEGRTDISLNSGIDMKWFKGEKQ